MTGTGDRLSFYPPGFRNSVQATLVGQGIFLVDNDRSLT
jgi:hypothetical protein